MKNIGIIGAGYTGIVAAYRLSQKGYKVTLLEKSEEIGGLAASFKLHGENIEKTYHHIFKTDKSIISLCDELGISKKLHWHESSLAIFVNGKIFPFMTPIDLLKFTPLKFHNRVRAGILALFLQKWKNYKIFENIGAYKWMLKWAGREVTRVIWEPLLKGKFEKYFDKVSMSWLWARINIRANSKQKGDLKEKLGYFNGGFNIIVDAIYEKLKKNQVNVLTETDVTKIKQADKNKVEVRSSKGDFVFDSVISTVPTHVFAKIIETRDQNYLQKIKKVKYLGAIVGIFSSSKSLSKFYWHNINDTSFPFLVFIEHTNLVPISRYKNKHVYYVGTYLPHEHKYFETVENKIWDEWFFYLKKIFPDFDQNTILSKNLFKLKYAQHIVECNYKNIMPDYETPIKNLYLCNFSQIYPEDRGTNFAVREGDKIAKMI